MTTITELTAKTNRDKVEAHLRSTGHISPAEARIVHGIERLAPRIMELRDDGMAIDTTDAVDEAGNGYTRYVFHPGLSSEAR